MKSLLAIFLLVSGAFSAVAELPGGWKTNLTAGLAEAKSRQWPVLVFFTASWCGPCKLMVRTTLTNEAVTKSLEGFCRIALDIDEHSDLADRLSISSIPTFQMLTSTGEEVARATGYQDAKQFLQWLTNSAASLKKKAAQRERAAQSLAGAETLLSSKAPGSMEKGVTQLLDLCAEREGSMVEPATARLTELARQQPVQLLPGLLHPQLAARWGNLA